jgi:DNA-directed RNA polymerase specialized sigma24 family protein
MRARVGFGRGCALQPKLSRLAVVSISPWRAGKLSSRSRRMDLPALHHDASPCPAPTPTQQLDALFMDAAFSRLIDRAAADTARIWHLPRRVAAGFVMSAVGEPSTLASLHEEWFSARHPSGLAWVIVRRRVCDLLRGDARRPRHESLAATAHRAAALAGLRADASAADPRAHVELTEIARLVQAALRSFAALGPTQARQADLVRRHALDGTGCTELAAQLACTPNALRVRVHKAMRALRRHIETCHPELEELLGRAAATGCA